MNNLVLQRLFLLRGLPGAGKSTFAHEICQNVISADDYFMTDEGEYRFIPSLLPKAHEWCLKQTEMLLYKNESVAVANTFTQEWEMKPYIALANRLDIPFFSIIVENRHGNESIHNVPYSSIQKMRGRFQVKL